MLLQRKDVYVPGDELQFEYQIDAIGPEDIAALEISVMWITEGKGTEDIGVHHFQRLAPSDVEGKDLRTLRRDTVRLPNTPFSYDGQILRIRWCVRVRLFVRGGKEFYEQKFFYLGNGPH